MEDPLRSFASRGSLAGNRHRGQCSPGINFYAGGNLIESTVRCLQTFAKVRE